MYNFFNLNIYYILDILSNSLQRLQINKTLINCYDTLKLDKKMSSLLPEVLKYLLNKKRCETTRFKKNCETTHFKKNCVLYIVVLRQSSSSQEYFTK